MELPQDWFELWASVLVVFKTGYEGVNQFTQVHETSVHRSRTDNRLRH